MLKAFDLLSWRLFLGLGLSLLLFFAVKSLQKSNPSQGQAYPSEPIQLVSGTYFIKLKPYFTFFQKPMKSPFWVRWNGESLVMSPENRKSLSEGKETLVGPVKTIYSGLNELFIEIPPPISTPFPLLFLTFEILKEGQSLLKSALWGNKKEHFMYTTHIYL